MKMKYRRVQKPTEPTNTRSDHSTVVMANQTAEESRDVEVSPPGEFWNPGHGCQRWDLVSDDSDYIGFPESGSLTHSGETEARRSSGAGAYFSHLPGLGVKLTLGRERGGSNAQVGTDTNWNLSEVPTKYRSLLRTVSGAGIRSVDCPEGTLVSVEGRTAGQGLMTGTRTSRSGSWCLPLVLLLLGSHMLHAQGKS